MRRHSHLSTLRTRVAVESARLLRKRPTPAESRLSYYLRMAPGTARFRFRRQAPIGSYIADFLCEPLRLVIEVDGGSHSESQVADCERTQWLAMQGYRVVRFWNHEVMGNIEGVMAEIERALAG